MRCMFVADSGKRYLGALAHVENKEYLTALSSMLSVEAEHESFLREALREVSRVIMPDVPPAKPFGTPLGLVGL